MTNSGGEIIVEGIWNNAGAVLPSGPATSIGAVGLAAGGTIVGGTIVSGGVLFNGGTLSGVDYVGTLDLSSASAQVTISNGITLSPTSGSSPDSVLLGQLGKQVFTGGYSYLDFVGTQTLSNAAISLGSTAILHAVGAGTTLTLDASTSITEASQVAEDCFMRKRAPVSSIKG